MSKDDIQIHEAFHKKKKKKLEFSPNMWMTYMQGNYFQNSDFIGQFQGESYLKYSSNGRIKPKGMGLGEENNL